MTYHRGDTVLVLFPNSNLRTSKRRPALIVQSDDLGTDLPQTLLAMITSHMTRAGQPSGVIVRGDRRGSEASGLLMDSVIMTGNLATILHSEIDRVLGSLGEMTEVDAALRKTLSI
jgi:mRNA interferase MazF